MAEPIAQIQAQLDAATGQLASTNSAGATSAQAATNALVARSVELAEAGGSLRTSTRPTLNRRKIAIELFRAKVNAHTMARSSVGHHEPSPLVCVSIRSEGKVIVMLRSRLECCL